MAVLNDCPGLKVEVTVNKQPLEEYDDDEEDLPKAVTKYIEAQSGAEFALKWTFSAPFQTRHGVQVTVNIDGKVVGMSTYTSERMYRQSGFSRFGDCSYQDGKRFRRNYCFTALNVVEEFEPSLNLLDLRKDVKYKGCIKLTFHSIDNIHHSNKIHKPREHTTLSAMPSIPEKVLKGDARSHQTTLGRPKEVKSSSQRMVYIVVDKPPFATVYFKYLSRGALRALRIVHDDEASGEETPVVPLEERPEEELNSDELRELLRRMRKREVESRPIKHEVGTERGIKRERVTVNEDDGDELMITKTRSVKRLRGVPEIIVLD